MKKLMLGLMMAFAATAEAEIVKNYELGELTATLDDQGVLTINGNGAMPDWGFYFDQVWFNESSQIKSVVAEAVTSVGQSAFDCCENLVSVSFPSATKIGIDAFYLCHKLTSVSLPSATTIGKSAFFDCPSLTFVSLPNATTIGELAFCSCPSLTLVSLPNATTVGASAFFDCSSLTLVSLPNATTIGAYAFAGCKKLTSVSLPNATTIGEQAFTNCDKIETVIVGFELLSKPDRESWKLRDEAKLVGPFTNDEVKNATHKVAVFAGETLMSGETYEKGCAYYGLTPKPEPQVVKEDEIAVKKESIQAAKAEMVEIVGGMVYLGVSVLSNSDITASTAWAPVKFTEDTQIGLTADGTKLVLPIPVAAQQGFMILQSGDAKAVPSDIMTDDGSNSWSHIVIKLKDILGIHKEVNSETLTIVGLSVDAANGCVLLKVGAETTAHGDQSDAILNVTVRKGAEVTVKVEHAESPAGPWTELQGVGGTVTVDSAGADIEVKLDGELPAQGYFRAKVEE